MKTNIFRILACIIIVLALRTTSAQNLLQNPGFESGNLNGWTTTGNVAVEAAPYTGSFSSLTLPTEFYTVNGAPDGGSYFAVMSPLGHEASTMSQSLGHLGPISGPVTVSFDYDMISGVSEIAAAKELSLFVGGQNVFLRRYQPSPADSQTGWQTESITLTPAEVASVEANGADLKFTFNPDLATGAVAIDNVSLSIPDSSSTLLLLCVILPGLFVCRRKLVGQNA